MTTIKLDPGAALLLDALHGAGHAAYAVGGCVRDSLLGLDPHDWDLCTSARPEQVMALFGAEKCIPTGLQHGTVTVKQGGLFRWPPPGCRLLCAGCAGGSCPAGFHHQRHGIQR